MAFLRSLTDDPQDENQWGPVDRGGGVNTPVVAPAVPDWVSPYTPETGGGGGGLGGGGGADLGGGFPSFGFGAVPRFTAPQFALPSFEEAQNEPGYKFRLKAGSDALERAAASKGLVRSGGTLKDLATWNQDFAAQEYNNVASRALGVFDRRYQGAKDEYAPLLAEWSTMSNAQLQKALAEYARGTVWNAPRGGGGGGVDLDVMPNPEDYY